MGAWEKNTGLNWAGSVSNDWSNSDNWTEGSIPLASSNVIIQSTANDSIIDKDVSNPAVCNNLTINSGAILSIPPGKALTVNGTLNNFLEPTGWSFRAMQRAQALSSKAPLPLELRLKGTSLEALHSRQTCTISYPSRFTMAVRPPTFSWGPTCIKWIQHNKIPIIPTTTANGSTWEPPPQHHCFAIQVT